MAACSTLAAVLAILRGGRSPGLLYAAQRAGVPSRAVSALNRMSVWLIGHCSRPGDGDRRCARPQRLGRSRFKIHLGFRIIASVRRPLRAGPPLLGSKASSNSEQFSSAAGTFRPLCGRLSVRETEWGNPCVQHEAPRVHHADRRRGGSVAARSGGRQGRPDRIPCLHVRRPTCTRHGRLSGEPSQARLRRRREPPDRVSLCRGQQRLAPRPGGRVGPSER